MKTLTITPDTILEHQNKMINLAASIHEQRMDILNKSCKLLHTAKSEDTLRKLRVNLIEDEMKYRNMQKVLEGMRKEIATKPCTECGRHNDLCVCTDDILE